VPDYLEDVGGKQFLKFLKTQSFENCPDQNIDLPSSLVIENKLILVPILESENVQHHTFANFKLTTKNVVQNLLWQTAILIYQMQ
jgi:hypothetical protein